MSHKSNKVSSPVIFSVALFANVIAGCSWNTTQAATRAQSLNSLVQADNSIVLAGTDGCPAADESFVGGCLRVPEQKGKDNSTTIQIFFEYLGEPDSNRETVVVLNGGPGGSLTPYTQAPQIRKLAQNYNVLFFDQRGVGRSSAITSENVANIDPQNYGTPENVQDISDLVSRVVKKPIIVLGHSYGAHLGFAFAVQHPEQVKAYVAFNGSSDNLGFLLQPMRKQTLINTALKTLDQPKLGALVQLINEGSAVDATGNKVSMDSLGLQLSLLVSSFEGQHTEVKNYVETIINANAEKINTILAAESVSRNLESASRSFRFDIVPNEGINIFVNKAITCQEMFVEESFAFLSESDRVGAKQFKTVACAALPPAPPSRIFDTKPLLNQIKSPVLIVSGDSDPLVAPETQKRDFALLKSLGKDVTLWTFKNTGHQIFMEAPQCTEKVLSEFLARINNSVGALPQENVCTEKDEFPL